MQYRSAWSSFTSSRVNNWSDVRDAYQLHLLRRFCRLPGGFVWVPVFFHSNTMQDLLRVFKIRGFGFDGTDVGGRGVVCGDGKNGSAPVSGFLDP
jgi:hypothetical protein